MNLSHKLTFSLASIFLLLVFAIVPTVMAAEGGPRVVSIVLDDSMTKGSDGPDNDAAATADNVAPMATVSEGKALLTKPGQLAGATNVARAELVDTTADTVAGNIRLIVTFSEDVYNDATAKPDAPNDPDSSLRDQSASRAIAADDLGTTDFTIRSALGITTGSDESSNVSITAVTRIQTAGEDTTATGDDVYDKRRFYVTISVTSGTYNSANMPLNIALVVNADAVFGIGENRVISPFKAAQVGVGNEGYVTTPSVSSPQQPHVQYDFQVVQRALSTIVVAGAPTRAIRSHEVITLTLTFTPGLNTADVPTRENLMLTNADIKADDPNTPDMDEGIKDISPDNAPRTKYEVTILPRGGLGDTYSIMLTNTVGTAFTLNQTYQVNNLPQAQRVTITGPSPVPADGVAFTVDIVYSVAPVTPLTVAGITVENGSIVTNSFMGSGTTYRVQIDPNNPTADNPVTVTVRVGQDFNTFVTSVKGTTPPPPPGDPHSPTEFTLTAGIEAQGYLVVTPATIGTNMNQDVLPMTLTQDKRETQPTMPDLEDLLYGGGTIDVYVDAGAGNTAADIIINEVMWALDENEVGTAGHTAHQWIELYNNSETNAAAGTITLWFKPRTLSGSPTDEGTRTDRLSNVLRFGTTTGWALGTNHGQSGNSDEDSMKEFISMYRKADKRGDHDGINGENWLPSTMISHVKHKGTPGEENTRTGVTVTKRPAPVAFTPPKSHVLINEVHNNSNDRFDWLELRFLQKTNLENWTLSYVKTDATEAEIMRFPKREFQAGDIVLIVNDYPENTDLIEGQDVTLNSNNQGRGAGDHKYWNPSNGNRNAHYLDIPNYNNGNFLLVLRTAKGWERLGSRDRLHDAVGRANVSKKTLTANTVQREPHTKYAKASGGDDLGYIWETETWPINGQDLRAHNAQGSNNDNAFLQPERNFAIGSVWARNGENHGWRKDGIYNPSNRGGLGYDRKVVASGTPGYDNGIVKGKSTDLANGAVVVSELMLTNSVDGRVSYPQWIELHNTSENTVDLHADTDGNGGRQGWSIRVENHRSGVWDNGRRNKLNVEVNFRLLGVRFIQPNQTILIVSDKASRRNVSETEQRVSHFPDHRVASIFGVSGNPFGMQNRSDVILNLNGFLIEIVDGNGVVSDKVGNLDGMKPDVFGTRTQFDDPFSWNWPSKEDMIVENARAVGRSTKSRTSLIRIYDDGVPRLGTPDRSMSGSMRGAVIPVGMTRNTAGKYLGKKYMEYAWVHASDTAFNNVQFIYYGSADDYGTPLYTRGTPLPVELSFFRPTLEDGKVTIQWTTESELDNAGFNILRSENRNGEFTQVNEQMIQGKGTTAERTTYKWVDTTAKPGVVYYYQIEDVSFAGEHTKLATTKLKGLISAKGKLTTQWGELKNLR